MLLKGGRRAKTVNEAGAEEEEEMVERDERG